METQGPDDTRKPTETGPPAWGRRTAFWLVVVLLGLTAGAVTFYNWRTIARFCQTPSECLNIVDFGVAAQRCIYYEKTDSTTRTFLIPPRTRQILNDVYVNRQIGRIPSLALSHMGPALDALFYLQKSEGLAINSESLQELFRNRNAVALLELLVPAGSKIASDPRRNLQRAELFEISRRLLATPAIEKDAGLKVLLFDKPLLLGALEPIFSVTLANEDNRSILVEAVAAVVEGVIPREVVTPQEPIPLPGVVDVRLRSSADTFRHQLAVPIEIAPKSQATISVRLIREEEFQQLYEMKLALSGPGFEIFTESFKLRM